MKYLLIASILFVGCLAQRKTFKGPVESKDLMSTGDTLYSNQWDMLCILHRNGDTTYFITPSYMDSLINNK